MVTVTRATKAAISQPGTRHARTPRAACHPNRLSMPCSPPFDSRFSFEALTGRGQLDRDPSRSYWARVAGVAGMAGVPGGPGVIVARESAVAT